MLVLCHCQSRGIQLLVRYSIGQTKKNGKGAKGRGKVIRDGGRVGPVTIGSLHIPVPLIVATDTMVHSLDGHLASETALDLLLQDIFPPGHAHLSRLPNHIIMTNTDYPQFEHPSRRLAQYSGETTTGFQTATETILGDQETTMTTGDLRILELMITTDIIVRETTENGHGEMTSGGTDDETTAGTLKEFVIWTLIAQFLQVFRLSRDRVPLPPGLPLPPAHPLQMRLLRRPRRAHPLQTQRHLHRRLLDSPTRRIRRCLISMPLFQLR